MCVCVCVFWFRDSAQLPVQEAAALRKAARRSDKKLSRLRQELARAEHTWKVCAGTSVCELTRVRIARGS